MISRRSPWDTARGRRSLRQRPERRAGGGAAVHVVTLAAVLAAGAVCGDRPDPIEVELVRTLADHSAPMPGLTNIFFFNAVDSGVTLEVPAGVESGRVELARLHAAPEDGPVIHVARMPDRTGTLIHVVDTDADLDFADETPLSFTSVRTVEVAPVDIRWQVLGRSAPEDHAPVRYEVIRSLDGQWTYGRIAEERRGTVVLPTGRTVTIVLRSRSRQHPFYSPDDSRLFLDMNGDGRITSDRTVTRNGRPAPGEELAMHEPFFLEGHAWRVGYIDPFGGRLTLMPVPVTHAVAEGFDAPPFRVPALDGAVVDLAQLRGRVVLLDFWSTGCRYSEQVRPDLNDFMAQHGQERLARVSMARETDAEGLRTFLAEHPRAGIVAAGDSAAWARYNPEIVTPLFILIDQAGVIRFVGRGVSAAPALEATAANLLEAARDRP